MSALRASKAELGQFQTRNLKWAHRKGFVIAAALIAILFAGNGLQAQTFSRDRWNFNVGAGVTPPIGSSNSRLDTGWHYSIGGGYDFTQHAAVTLEFSRTGLGVSDSVLNALDVPDGNARVYSLTLNPVYRFRTGERVGGYAIGGIGYYRRTVEFTQPTTAVVLVFDPWWGYLGPALVPANQILGSISSNAAGFNVGGGMTIGVGEGRAKFYTELRYHYANTRNTPTQMLPLTFGIRW